MGGKAAALCALRRFSYEFLTSSPVVCLQFIFNRTVVCISSVLLPIKTVRSQAARARAARGLLRQRRLPVNGEVYLLF